MVFNLQKLYKTTIEDSYLRNLFICGVCSCCKEIILNFIIWFAAMLNTGFYYDTSKGGNDRKEEVYFDILTPCIIVYAFLSLIVVGVA